MSAPTNRPALGAFYVVVSSACFAAMGLCVQLAAANAPQLLVTYGTFVTGWLILIPIALVRGGMGFFATRHPQLMMSRAVIGTLQITTLFLALGSISLVEANLMREAAPLWVPLLLWLFWREAMPQRLWFGIILGFAGMALVLHPGVTHLAIGYVFALVNGILFAFQSILSRRLGEVHEPVHRILCYIYTTAIVLLFIPALLSWQPVPLMSWLYTGLAGLIMVGSSMLLLMGFQQAPAYVVAPFGYTTIVFSALLDWAVFDRVPTTLVIVGSILVIVASFLIVRLSSDHPSHGPH
ncbi:MAG: DMT family transporter [Pseudomonadota bacterium]